MSLKIAVIGAGSMGGNHARIYNNLADVDLVGIVDIDFSASVIATKRFGGRSYASIQRMMEMEHPDAVSIATPATTHLDVAREVIEYGAHVLVEKPIAHKSEDGRKMIEIAKRAGLLLVVGHTERFNPVITTIERLLKEKILGKVFQIETRRQGPPPPRATGTGVAVDLAVHDLDIMLQLTHANIIHAYAELGYRPHSKATEEDALSALLRFDNGIIGSLAVSWLTPTKVRELLIVGEKGMLHANYLTQDLSFFENGLVTQDGWDTLRVMRGISEGKMVRYFVPKTEPLRLELEAFVSAVQSEAAFPVNGAEALQALHLAEMLVQSGKEHAAAHFQ
jgi:predicted dehydrogenase